MTIDEFKKNIAPHMKKGWVAMDEDNKWFWHNDKPVICGEEWLCRFFYNLKKFDIEPVDNWKESLIEVSNDK